MIRYHKTITVEMSEDISEDQIDLILDSVDYELGIPEKLNTDDIIVSISDYWS